MEPDGGNLYKPHVFQINSGQFWRCAHGSTGFGGNPLEWVGCEECGKAEPQLKYKLDRKNITDTTRLDYLEYQGQAIPIINKGVLHHYSGHFIRDALDHSILSSDWYKNKNVHS